MSRHDTDTRLLSQMLLVITDSETGGVLAIRTGDSVDDLLDQIAARVTQPEEDVDVSFDVVRGAYEEHIRNGGWPESFTFSRPTVRWASRLRFAFFASSLIDRDI